MRQVFIQIPRDYSEHVVTLIKNHQGKNLFQIDETNANRPGTLLIASLSNRQMGNLLDKLKMSEIPEIQVTFAPQDVFALKLPASEVPKQVIDLEPRSPLEVFLGALQSIGSWKGFIGYAIAAAVVVWIGLFTNSLILLLAGMLIAPFAGPAMNVASATARGDDVLLLRSLLRYLVALVVTVLTSAVVSLVLRQDMVTVQMDDMSQVSRVSALLPLIVGAAGALNLIQSERASLVSGTATGVLVAASLAPPAGLVGMATVLGKWSMVQTGIFLVFLQLIGINLSGTLVFRFYDWEAQDTQYDRGRKWLFPMMLGISLVLFLGMLVWQFSLPPHLQRSSIAQRATGEIESLIQNNNQVALVQAQTQFTPDDIQGQNTLLVIVYVQRNPGVDTAPYVIEKQLSDEIEHMLLERLKGNITPLATVIVLDSPKGQSMEKSDEAKPKQYVPYAKR